MAKKWEGEVREWGARYGAAVRRAKRPEQVLTGIGSISEALQRMAEAKTEREKEATELKLREREVVAKETPRLSPAGIGTQNRHIHNVFLASIGGKVINPLTGVMEDMGIGIDYERAKSIYKKNPTVIEQFHTKEWIQKKLGLAKIKRTRPPQVSQEDWNKATDKQKEDLSKVLGGAGE